MLERPIRTAHELWLPEHGVIFLRSGMRVVHKRAALTHALGHVILSHDDDRPRHERQADRFAAEHLIHPREFASAAAWCADDAQLCAELGVTLRVLRAYVPATG